MSGRRERVRLTKAVIDRAVHAGASNQTFYRDTELLGFALRVTDKGSKSYVIEYTFSGRSRRLTLGLHGRLTVDQARKLAQKEFGRLAAGEDPADRRRRKREGETLADVAERYLSDLKARAEAGARRGRLSGWDAAQALWRLHVPAVMKRRKVGDVATSDIHKLHAKLGRAGKPATADHLRTVLHSVFELAITEGLLVANPVGPVKRFNKPPKRRRALTLDELASMGKVLDGVERTGELGGRSMDKAAVLALRLLAMTGMRKSELLGHHTKARRGPREGLRWSDVDLDAGTYELASHGGGSGGKGGAPRTLPLGAATVELLRSVRPEDVDEELPVVPSARRPKDCFQGVSPARERVYQAAGIEDADTHCLRHSFESIAYGLGPAYAGCLTGRAVVQGSLAAYVHIDADVLHELADKVAGRIDDAMRGKLGGEVVAIESRRRGAR